MKKYNLLVITNFTELSNWELRLLSHLVRAGANIYLYPRENRKQRVFEKVMQLFKFRFFKRSSFEQSLNRYELIPTEMDILNNEQFYKEKNITHIINLSKNLLDGSELAKIKQIFFYFFDHKRAYLNFDFFLFRGDQLSVSLCAKDNHKIYALKSGCLGNKKHSFEKNLESVLTFIEDWLPSVVRLSQYEEKQKLLLGTRNQNSIFDFVLSFVSMLTAKAIVFISFIRRFFIYQQWNLGRIDLRPSDLLSVPDGGAHLKRQWVTEVPWLSSYADPFLFKHKNKYKILFENFNFKSYLGKISLAEFSDEKEFALSKSVDLLNDQTHFSFPCLFQKDEELYFCPENKVHKKISLYRMHPDQLTIVDKLPLLSGESFVDPVLFFHDKTYWIFTGRFEQNHHGTAKLYLYFSDTLSGEFQEHPQNPIVTDQKSARNAGHIVFLNDKIYRPSQNCIRHYGQEIIMNEIVELTKTSYKEVSVSKIKPSLDYPMGCHHISICDDVVIVDGQRHLLSFSVFFYKLKNFILNRG